MAKAIIISHQENWLREVSDQMPAGLDFGSWNTENQSNFDVFIHADLTPVAFGENVANTASLHVVNCYYARLQEWEIINPGWNIVACVKWHPAFFAGNNWEMVCTETQQQKFTSMLRNLGITPRFVAEGPCTTSARLVAMIINEAYLTLDEQVAAEADIDLAMKLGTGYPFGPFEWAQKIGKAEVVNMLIALQNFHGSERYKPSKLLLQQAHD